VGDATQPLEGTLVVELSRYLPGAYAGRELRRLGARVVRVEAPEGDPMRQAAPAWDRALRAGKESVTCDLREDAAFVRALCARADVVLEGFRPGVATRLGIGPADVPETVVYCSLTGFGSSGRHAARAGHDLNYLGWAGALEDTAPSQPPLQIADLGAGSLAAVTEILAALLRRARTGRGGHVEISITHRAHDLVAHRLGGDPVPRMLTGGLACYRVYPTADGRYLTVAALEPKFFERLCELIGSSDLAARQFDGDQEALARDLAAELARRSLQDWLDLFDGEDVCVGPVSTLAEAAADLGGEPGDVTAEDVPLGSHSAAWRSTLRL
jgi:crotonobetainyl-CoA:carnitine CoA-transferase CaiB-like acyl-CoA transferase